MIANEHYWDRRNVRSAIIDQIYIDDQMAAFRAYDSGEVDWLADMDNDMAADLLLKNRPELKVFPNFGTYFYDFNCEPKLKDGTKNPFADRRVRRAFCMAIDKEPIVRNVTRTGEPVTSTLVPHGSFADYPSPPGLPYDLPEARRLMAEAGYPALRAFPASAPDVQQRLFAARADRPGAPPTCRRTSASISGWRPSRSRCSANACTTNEFNIGRASLVRHDYYDPTTFTDVFKSASDNNDPDWRVPAYDDLLHKAELEMDPHKRLQDPGRGREPCCSKMRPILPLYQYVGHYLFRDNVHGISPGLRD